MALMPRPAPAMFPMLKASPPNETRMARRVPSPGKSVFATSCARRSATATTRQMFSWAARSKRTETRIAKPKLARSCPVKTAVWVRKPGPMALVAMRKAAPTRILRTFDRDSGTSDVTSGAASAIEWRLLRLGRRVAEDCGPIYQTAPLVLGVGERRHAEELAKRRARRSRQSLVLLERQDDDITGVVMNQLRTVGERAPNDVA